MAEGNTPSEVVNPIASNTPEVQAQIPKTPDHPLLQKEIAKITKQFSEFSAALQQAGVSEDQVKKAQEISEQKVRTEFDKKERQDPFTLVDSALRSSAETPVEQNAARESLLKLKQVREALARKSPGTAPYIKETQLDGLTYPEWHPDRDNPHFQYRIDFHSRYDYPEKYAQYNGEFTPQMQEKFLRQMGALEEGQTLKELIASLKGPIGTENPEVPYKTSQGDYQVPGYEAADPRRDIHEGVFARLPTKLPGVEVRISAKKTSVILAPDALRKVAAVPAVSPQV